MSIITWILIGIALFLVITFMKVRHFKHRFVAIMIILVLVFFYVSASKVLAGKNADLTSLDGVLSAGKIYFLWIWHVGGNMGTLAGNAIKMDWIGNNEPAISPPITEVNSTDEWG